MFVSALRNVDFALATSLAQPEERPTGIFGVRQPAWSRRCEVFPVTAESHLGVFAGATSRAAAASRAGAARTVTGERKEERTDGERKGGREKMEKKES